MRLGAQDDDGKSPFSGDKRKEKGAGLLPPLGVINLLSEKNYFRWHVRHMFEPEFAFLRKDTLFVS